MSKPKESWLKAEQLERECRILAAITALESESSISASVLTKLMEDIPTN